MNFRVGGMRCRKQIGWRPPELGVTKGAHYSGGPVRVNAMVSNPREAEGFLPFRWRGSAIRPRMGQ